MSLENYQKPTLHPRQVVILLLSGKPFRKRLQRLSFVTREDTTQEWVTDSTWSPNKEKKYLKTNMETSATE